MVVLHYSPCPTLTATVTRRARRRSIHLRRDQCIGFRNHSPPFVPLVASDMIQRNIMYIVYGTMSCYFLVWSQLPFVEYLISSSRPLYSSSDSQSSVDQRTWSRRTPSPLHLYACRTPHTTWSYLRLAPDAWSWMWDRTCREWWTRWAAHPSTNEPGL